MIRIALDLDDTIFDWRGEYSKLFGNIDTHTDEQITKNVRKCQYNKDFWSNLPLLEEPDFTPTIYSTKRISSKDYTRNNLRKYNLPIVPIYQMVSQLGNKANQIKGVADILIDDSIYNVKQALDVGFPALLINREHNQHDNSVIRIYSLSIEDILNGYDILMRNGELYYNPKTYFIARKH